jgi:ribonuclease HII
LAAAVHLPEPIVGITDSKKLPRARREELALLIREHAIWALGAASVAEIDHLNILAASHLAMRRAFARLQSQVSTQRLEVLVDGHLDPKLGRPVQCIVGGDGLIAEIGAASIIAKVARDHLLARLGARHPAYGFERHAGYPTAAHRAALAQQGVCAHHRRSFAPVRAALASVASSAVVAQ